MSFSTTKSTRKTLALANMSAAKCGPGEVCAPLAGVLWGTGQELRNRNR